MLVDNEDVITNVERWQLNKIRWLALEVEDRDAKKCEEARDKVPEWCENHDPRSAWRRGEQQHPAQKLLQNS